MAVAAALPMHQVKGGTGSCRVLTITYSFSFNAGCSILLRAFAQAQTKSAGCDGRGAWPDDAGALRGSRLGSSIAMTLPRPRVDEKKPLPLLLLPMGAVGAEPVSASVTDSMKLLLAAPRRPPLVVPDMGEGTGEATKPPGPLEKTSMDCGCGSDDPLRCASSTSSLALVSFLLRPSSSPRAPCARSSSSWSARSPSVTRWPESDKSVAATTDAASPPPPPGCAGMRSEEPRRL